MFIHFRSRDKTPQKQEELREWMARKRKLRHKEWSQKLDEKRETEFKPFQSKLQKEQVSLVIHISNHTYILLVSNFRRLCFV